MDDKPAVEEIDYKEFLDDYPLLDKFRQVAPGSYKHCQNVSSIVESIAKELDMDVDLMKVCASYHDIGKINYPQYFSENQSTKTNIHDSLSPDVSCRYITGHLSDGIMILMQHEFPMKAIEIISEHHGDTVLRQFHKNDPEAPEDNYRYKSRKPSSSEAVVLMLVDSVEALARSEFMRQRDGEGSGDFIKRAVQSTIDRLDDDDQLDNVVHGLIKRVKKIIIRELEASYHKRVSYDDEPDKVKE